MKFRDLRKIIGFGAIGVCIVITGFTAFLIEHTRRQTVSGVEALLEQRAKTAESAINRQVLQTDSALAGIPLLLSSEFTEKTLAAQHSVVVRLLQSMNFQHLVYRDLLLLTTDGTIWAAARSRARALPFAEEALQRLGASGGSVVIGPIRNPMTDDWVWYLARKIAVPERGPMLAVAEIPVATFLSPLADLSEIEGFKLRIERSNGLGLGSLPHDEIGMGRLTGARPSENWPVGQGSGGRSIAGDFEVRRQILHPDLLLRLTLSKTTAFAAWQGNRTRFILMATGGATVILLVALGLIRLLQREERLYRERHRAQTLLAESIEAMSDGFIMWDRNDRLVTCNSRFRELYAISSPFLVPGATFESVIRAGAERGQYPQAVGDIEGFVTRTTEWHRAASGTYERLLPDGRWLMISDRKTPSGAIVGIRTDVTEMRLMLDELGVANERIRDALSDLETQNILFNAAVSNMSQGLLMVDRAGAVIVHNRRFADLLGIADWRDEDGLRLPDLFARIAAAGTFGPGLKMLEHWQAGLARERQSGSETFRSGTDRTIAVAQQPLENGGFVATYEDVTGRQEAEARIRFLAHHDALTELPNRVLFRDGLVSRIKNLGRSRQEIAVLYLDLDKFKDVNDTLGHPSGDALLGLVARRLRACLRENDLVARLGGDEFAVAISGSGIAERTAQLADRIIASLGAPYELEGQIIRIGVSIGAAMTKARTCAPDTLIRNADMALYEAKAQGRGGYCFFEASIESRLISRLATERDLRVAVGAEQFEIAYQPLVEMASGRTIGFEALLRWNHPLRGQVAPGLFIPIAEETGLIRDIGAWCLRKACADAAQMPGGVKIAVNLSPVQLKTDDIVQQILATLETTGLAPGRLELEITESALLDDDERIVGHLHRLREAGIRIVLDDFGTGYSSLNYLRRFPFNKIKIDKVFVADATTRQDCAVIVSSTIDLARQLGMTTTAEGIETEEQLELLRTLGCTEGQGYLLGKPSPLLAAFARFGDSNVVPISMKRVHPLRGA